MIFVTVGTVAPFDRLVIAIDELVGSGRMGAQTFIQTGTSSYRPRNVEWVRTLNKHDFEARVRMSTSLVSHAGMGTIIQALEHQKPLLVLPRLRTHGEHVNDHQVPTARQFEASGHVLAAYSVAELPEKLGRLATFVPKPRVAQPEAVAARIAEFLRSELSTRR